MIFKCRNCGGNVVYSPEKKAMYCPHCEGIDSEQKLEGSSEDICSNCGAPLNPSEYTSALRCEHCGHYIVFDDKVQGSYNPNLIMPFKVGKESVKEILKKEFKKRAFTPSSFLSEASLDKMEGSYVPFWLYDYMANCVFDGEGTRVRSWRSGNKEYTETSHYKVVRDMDIDYDKIPVDASILMDDGTMDLMEPYDYRALENFQEKYMSGFYAEFFNQDAITLEHRALAKVRGSAEAILNESLSGYSTLKPFHRDVRTKRLGYFYALFPVWIYTYRYREQTYTFYVNGQTGKAIGKTPLSVRKMIGYAATVFVAVAAMFEMVLRFYV
ncbi:MAG: hypothetical protein NC313_08430 [Butyrivibrio sp.]|nr:hypothetical protein [Butyrivibrio sp.]